MERYGPLRQIRKNRRFAAYEGSHGGDPVFVKQAVDESLRPRLLEEAAGLTNMRELDAAEAFYRVPKVIELDGDHIVTQWAPGKMMEDAFIDDDDDAVTRHLAYLVKLYAWIDTRSQGQVGVTRYNRPHEIHGADVYAKRLENVDYSAYVDGELVLHTLDYLRKTLLSTETRFTNGDLQPGNLLVDGETIWLIDCETTSWLWPRHYNIVNFVFNYGSRYPARVSQLKDFFGRYCAAVGVEPDRDASAFNVSAASRSIGIVIEQLSASEDAGGRTIDPSIKEYAESAMRRIVTANELFVELG